MRRIIHGTTAIAATLALLMPQLASAEMRIPNDRAEKQEGPRQAAMPELAAILQQELDKGLTVADLLCADDASRPCADDVNLVTPRGVTVQVSEDGKIVLAPEKQQVSTAAELAAGSKADRKQAKAADKAERKQAKAEEKAARKEAKAEEKAAKKEAKAEAKAKQTAVEQAPKQKPATPDDLTDEIAAAIKAKTDDTAKPAPKPMVEKSAKPAAKPDQLAQALIENKDDAAVAAAIAAAAANKSDKTNADKPATKAADANALYLLQGDVAQARAKEMPGLARVLKEEIDAGLTRDQLLCQTGEPAPCPDGVELMTPRGAAVRVSDDGGVALVAVQRQTNFVNRNGKVVPRAPEADTVETAAAKEAAKEAAAPKVSTLDNAGGGKVVEEQKVTRENTRSSSQDFEASLRNALEQATGAKTTQPAANQAASSNNDNNDLAKALILGLGAVAVGQMLNNNRQVALSTPDRVVVQRNDGSQEVIKDEVALLRQPGSTVTTENFDDGSSRTIVTREDGSKVVTIRDADLRVLRRTLISADGTSTMLIDDTAEVQPVDVATLPEPAEAVTTSGGMTEDDLRAALQRESQISRRFTLGQIRNIPEVRALVAPVNIDAITFDTGSAAIKPDQAQQLADLGQVIQEAVANNPREIFMIEGYTDTVGADAMNLALSDRRAESVALALSEYFDVPPENLVVQGYGEQFLKVRAEGDIRENRRASVRRITDLLRTAEAN